MDRISFVFTALCSGHHHCHTERESRFRESKRSVRCHEASKFKKLGKGQVFWLQCKYISGLIILFTSQTLLSWLGRKKKKKQINENVVGPWTGRQLASFLHTKDLMYVQLLQTFSHLYLQSHKWEETSWHKEILWI